MGYNLLFDEKQRILVAEALEVAEALTGAYFRIDLDDFEKYPFDLKTLQNLQGPEKTHWALAQVCKYEYTGMGFAKRRNRREFYRICLQDDRILNRARVEADEMLRPLLLYVISHELIHVIRFSLEPARFHFGREEKRAEERKVHRMTHEILETLHDPQIEGLLQQYRPYWGGDQIKGQSFTSLEK
jgi:hypothetical protein